MSGTQRSFTARYIDVMIESSTDQLIRSGLTTDNIPILPPEHLEMIESLKTPIKLLPLPKSKGESSR